MIAYLSSYYVAEELMATVGVLRTVVGSDQRGAVNSLPLSQCCFGMSFERLNRRKKLRMKPRDNVAKRPE